MQPRITWKSLLVPALLGAALWPCSGFAADSAPASPLTLTLARAVGAEGVIASGTTTLPVRTLEATVYATFSRDLPTTVLSRRTIPVGANGAFSVSLSTAPAFFRDAIVTVVIRSPKDGLSAVASVSVTGPNIDTPADAWPR